MARQQQQTDNVQSTISDFAAERKLDADAMDSLMKAKRRAQSALDETQNLLLKVEAALQILLAKPTGKTMKAQIKNKVDQFIKSGRQDLEERQRFNGWLRTIGVQMTLKGKDLSCFSWQEGTRKGEAYVYRQGEDIIADETLCDMAVLGATQEQLAERREQIKREKQQSGV